MKRSIVTACVAITISYLLVGLVYRQGERAPHASTASIAPVLVEDILLGRDPGGALCRLIGLRRYHSKPRYELEECTSLNVRQVIGFPGGDVFGVTFEFAHLDKVHEALFAGVLAIFDRDGFMIPVYRGANLLTAADGFFRYRGGREWAIAHVIPTRAGNESNATVQILSIVPLARDQRAALRVIVGPPVDSGCEGFPWSWRQRDIDGDRIPEIEIGPHVDSSWTISPRAVFRWSSRENRYMGPDGSPQDLWLRLDGPDDAGMKRDCCGAEAIERYAGAAALGFEGLHRPICDPIEIVTETIRIH